MARSVPPRIHAILAREANSAIVIRRGPSQRTAVLGWDLERDAFSLGQWVAARIYERRCDLSPDGQHFIYFALNGKWGSRSKGSWTAISRAPYLKALTMLPKGDAWFGGGLFTSNDEYWLNGGIAQYVPLHDDSRLRSVDQYPWHERYGGECPGVYYIRLQRDGWRLKDSPADAHGEVHVFEKPISRRWLLRKNAYARGSYAQGRGVYFDEHELVHEATGSVHDYPAWEWADFDARRERLVWAEGGFIRTGGFGHKGLSDVRDLCDLNGMTFQAIEAPY